MKLVTRTLLALLLITPLFAHADEASKKVKIEELMQLTHMNQLMSRMMDQMTVRMKASASQQAAKMNMNAEQKAAFDDYQQKLNQLLASSVSWDKMKPVMIQVYSETYTDQELDGILTFYRSPAGQAMVAKSPELMSKSMNLIVQQMSTLQPQIEQLSKDLAVQMQKSAPTPAK